MTQATSPDQIDTKLAWARLARGVVAAAVGNIGMWSYIIVMPLAQAEYGLDRGEATIPYTFAMLGFALGNFGFGAVVDRFGLRFAMLVSAALLAGGHMLAATAGSLWALCALHFLIGTGAGVNFGPLLAEMSLWFYKRRGLAVGIAASANYLSGAIWPLALNSLMAGQGWRQQYWVIAATVLLVVVPLALSFGARAPDNSGLPARRRQAVQRSDGAFSPSTLPWLLALAGIGCCVAMSMPQVHMVAYCVDLGYGPAVGGQMLATMLLAGIASRLVSGLVADRIGGLPTLLIGSTLQGLSLLFFLPFDGIVSLYLVSLLFGLAQGGIVPAYAVILREYLPPKGIAVRVGFVVMATILGMALGGWMAGWIYDQSGGYRLAFVNGIGWNLLNLAIVGGLWLASRRDGQKALA